MHYPFKYYHIAFWETLQPSECRQRTASMNAGEWRDGWWHCKKNAVHGNEI